MVPVALSDADADATAWAALSPNRCRRRHPETALPLPTMCRGPLLRCRGMETCEDCRLCHGLPPLDDDGELRRLLGDRIDLLCPLCLHSNASHSVAAARVALPGVRILLTPPPGSAAERVRQLRQARDAGLITLYEYRAAARRAVWGGEPGSTSPFRDRT